MKLCGFEVGLGHPLFLIAGPCVVESESLQIEVAGRLKEMCAALAIPFIFKSSYDKANRSSHASFRGPGMDEGLRILAEVRRQVGVPVLTDVHTVDEIPTVAAVVDVLQTPAFLCRQTDFIQAVARAGSGCVSMNTPATPAATAARASTGTNSRWPPEDVPCPPGSWTECVASNTTGQPVSRMIASERMSETRLL